MKFLSSGTFLRVMVLCLFLIAGSTLSSCKRKSHSVKTVQPIRRKRPFNPKKDKYRKRVKTVKKRYN